MKQFALHIPSELKTTFLNLLSKVIEYLALKSGSKRDIQMAKQISNFEELKFEQRFVCTTILRVELWEDNYSWMRTNLG